jgi:hypothetical protein
MSKLAWGDITYQTFCSGGTPEHLPAEATASHSALLSLLPQGAFFAIQSPGYVIHELGNNISTRTPGMNGEIPLLRRGGVFFFQVNYG